MEKPIYQQLRDAIYEDIKDKAPNTPILSEREMAEHFGASRMTVRKAIRKLVEEGYLYRDKNKGTFIADQKLHKKKSSSMLFYSKSKHEDHKVLHFDVKNSVVEINKKLEINLQDSFVQIVRLNVSNDIPQSVDEVYLVRKTIPNFDKRDIDELLDFEDYIDKGVINQSFIPIKVPVQYAALLHLKINTPIIMVESLISDYHGRIYGFVRTYPNPNQVQIELTL